METYQNKLRAEIALIINDIELITKNNRSTLTFTDYLKDRQRSTLNDLTSDGLLINLRKIIYEQFYKRLDLPKANTWDEGKNRNGDFKEFIEKTISNPALYKADQYSGQDWLTEFMSFNSGSLIVQRRGYEKKHIFAGHYNTDALDFPLKDNEPVKVSWFKANRFRGDNDFFYLHGHHIPDDYSGAVNQIRFYLNFIANDTFQALFPQLIQELLVAFNLKKIPFEIKVLTTIFSRNNSKKYEYDVSDTSVIYLENRYFQTSYDLILSIVKQEKYSPILAKHVPMFIRQLAEGVGFAENPLNSDNSFGQESSLFLARTIVDIFNENNRKPTENELIEKINKEYSDGQFFLNPLRVDAHPRSPVRKPFPYFFDDPLVSSLPKLSNELTLNIAQQIGYIICKEAIWDHKRRCNWIGHDGDKSYKTLDATVLSGTSGVALFLGNLYEQAEDPTYLNTIEGTLRYINDNLKKLIETKGWGFYKGASGAIYTLLKVSKQIRNPDLFSKKVADILATKLTPFPNPIQIEDWTILDGLAGNIMGLRKLWDYLPDGSKGIVQQRIHEGITLLNTVDSRNFFNKDQLMTAGYAKGLGGIGLTLIEIGRFLGNNTFAERGKELITIDIENIKNEMLEGRWLDDIGEPAYFLALNQLLSFSQDPAIKQLVIDEFNSIKNQNSLFYKIFNVENGLGILELCVEMRNNFPVLQDTIETKYKKEFLGEIKTSFETDTYTLNLGGLPFIVERLQGLTLNFNVNLLYGLAGVGYGILRLHDPKKVESILILQP